MKPKQSKFVTPLSFRGWPYQPPIRRATLIVDPVKPRKPKRFQSSAFKAAHELAARKRKGAA